MIIKRQISETYRYPFTVPTSGLVAIFVSARCKSKIQIQDELKDDFKELFG